MKNRKIDFRLTEQEYNEILKEAEKAGISVNALAREIVINKIRQKEGLPEGSGCKMNNITPLSHMEISRELIQLQHYVEKLPENSDVKNQMRERLENIWLILS